MVQSMTVLVNRRKKVASFDGPGAGLAGSGIGARR